MVTIEKERKLLSRIRKHKKPLLIILAVVALLLLIGIIYSVTKPALRVGNYSYNKQEYNQLLAQARELGVGKKEARAALAKSLASRAAADELGVRYSLQDDIVTSAAYLEFNINERSKPNQYQKEVSIARVIDPAVAFSASGGYESIIIDIPFSRYIVGFVRDDFGDKNLIGNEAAIRDDMKYAEIALQKYKTMLESNNESSSNIIKEIEADKRLVNGQYANASRRAFITEEKKEVSISGESEVRDMLFEQVKRAAQDRKMYIVSDVVFSYPPTDYGLNMPDLVRGEGTLVGWQMINVVRKSDKQPDIIERFEKLVKEYSDV